MKKKYFAASIICALVLCMSACGDNKASTATEDTPKTEEEAEPKEQATATPAPTSETSLDGLEKHLLDAGVLSGRKTETAAAMIGAVSGFKYADSESEFYEFDENSDAYKSLAESGSVELQGMNVSIKVAAINGKYILIGANDVTPSQEIMDAFNSYGK